jgi:hypothetical protein
LTSRGPAWNPTKLRCHRDAASRAAITSADAREEGSRRPTTLISVVNNSETELAHSGMLDAHTMELVPLDLIHVTRRHQHNVIIDRSPSCFVRSNERANSRDGWNKLIGARDDENT